MISAPGEPALAIARGTVPPASVVQGDLARAGVPLVWFDDLPVDHTDFAAIQWTAVRGLYPLGAGVHASPDAPISRAEAAIALTGLPRERAIEQGWMATDHRN